MQSVIQYYFVFCLFAIALYDLKYMLIPVVLLYPTIILGLVSAWAYPNPDLDPWMWLFLEPRVGPHWASLVGCIDGLLVGWGMLKIVSSMFEAIHKKKGLGDGDPIFLGFIGAFLGWRVIPDVILVASLSALFCMLVIWAFKRKTNSGLGQKPLPFTPFLALGAFWGVFGPANLRLF